MNPFLISVLCLLAGGLLGWGYFWGLWYTVNKMVDAEAPKSLMVISFILRSVVVLAGFYLMLIQGWQYLAVALIGFMVVRWRAVKYWGLYNEMSGKIG